MRRSADATTLSGRMKRYEQALSPHLTRRIPVVVRVDGRAFHTFTRGCERPFDPSIVRAMTDAAGEVAAAMDGCRLAYVQSDEASFLLTDFARLETEAWFGYDLQKIVSLSAASMTLEFADSYSGGRPMFDSRAFSIPREEVANYFLWRARDWHRNSVLMFAQSYFSPKQMHGKKLPELHEMLHEIGKNWATDTTPQERNGTFLLDGEVLVDVEPHYAPVASLVDAALTWHDEENSDA